MDVLNPDEWVTIRRAELDALRTRAQQPTDSHLLRVSQVAERLAISRSEAYRLVGTAIPAITIGRAVRVHPADLQSFIDQARRR